MGTVKYLAPHKLKLFSDALEIAVCGWGYKLHNWIQYYGELMQVTMRLRYSAFRISDWIFRLRIKSCGQAQMEQKPEKSLTFQDQDCLRLLFIGFTHATFQEPTSTVTIKCKSIGLTIRPHMVANMCSDSNVQRNTRYLPRGSGMTVTCVWTAL